MIYGVWGSSYLACWCLVSRGRGVAFWILNSIAADPLSCQGYCMSLELRPNCECCDRDLPPASDQAFICTFECTFCLSCASDKLGFVCPNCGGELLRRPIRPPERLVAHPASKVRVVRSTPCAP